MELKIKKAERKQTKLRLLLSGPAGSGKTYSMLTLASVIGQKALVFDTENGSAKLYADRFDFDVIEHGENFSPEVYIAAIDAAEKGGYDVLCFDSITHEWTGPGGCLDIKEQISRKDPKKNDFTAWKEVTPLHNRFVDRLLNAKVHIIATARSKKAYEMTNEGIRVKQNSDFQGLSTQQRQDLEYEFTTVLSLVRKHNIAVPLKDRTGLFSKAERIGIETGQRLKRWLDAIPEYDKETGEIPNVSEHAAKKLKTAVDFVENCQKTIARRNKEYLAFCVKIFENEGKSHADIMNGVSTVLKKTVNGIEELTDNEISRVLRGFRGKLGTKIDAARTAVAGYVDKVSEKESEEIWEKFSKICGKTVTSLKEIDDLEFLKIASATGV